MFEKCLPKVSATSPASESKRSSTLNIGKGDGENFPCNFRILFQTNERGESYFSSLIYLINDSLLACLNIFFFLAKALL